MGWVLFREREYPHARRLGNWLAVSVVSYRMVFLFFCFGLIISFLSVNPNDIAGHALMHFPGNARTNYYIEY